MALIYRAFSQSTRIKESAVIVQSLHQIAIDNMERNIEANYTAFGKTPEPDELEELYATCLRIALKERSGEYLQGVKNLDALHTGLYMLPLSLTSLIVAPFSAFLVRILPPKRLVQMGLFVNTAAFLVLRYSLRVDSSFWTLAPGFILFGLGIGLIMAQVSNITLSAVSVEEAGEASGVNNTLRQVGATLGSAIMGAILISSLTTNLSNGVTQSNAIPAPVKAQVSEAFAQNASRIEFSGASSFEGNIPQTNMRVWPCCHGLRQSVGGRKRRF
jgi:hypothetical protein